MPTPALRRAPGAPPPANVVAAGARRHGGASVRVRVFCRESYRLGLATAASLRGAPHAALPADDKLAAPRFADDFRQLWRDADYRGQFFGRAFTHLGQGMGSGAQTLLLSSTVKLTAAQGLLVNSCINAAELLVHQLAGVWRGLFSDQARNGELASGGATPARLGRHQLVTRLMLAGIYEVGIAACLLGVLFCRGARLLQGRRILLVLATIRVARIFCQATQWASFDGLKGQIEDQDARRLVRRRWDSTKAVETGVGLCLNQAAAIACQMVPYVLPCPSMVAAMACMMAAGLVISLGAKLQLGRYLDEGAEPAAASVLGAKAEAAPAAPEPAPAAARTPEAATRATTPTGSLVEPALVPLPRSPAAA